MGKKYAPEQIINKLRETKVLTYLHNPGYIPNCFLQLGAG